MVNWTPANLATQPLKWLDANDSSTLTTASNVVSSWASKGSNTTAYTQSTTARRPTYNATGFNSAKPAVVFNASTLLDSALAFTGTTCSVFVVGSHNPANAFGVAFSLNAGDVGYSNNSYADFIESTGDGNGYLINERNGQFPTYSAASLGSPGIFNAGYTGSSSFANINAGTAATNTSAYTGAFNSTRNSIGGEYSSGQSSGLESMWNGPISEVIFLGYNPSTSDRQYIEGYLAWKWGIQAKLPSSHPYYNAAPQQASSGPSSNNGASTDTTTTLPANAWTPTQLGNRVYAWYDPSDTSTTTVSGGLASQLKDKSGNVRHLNSPSSAFYPYVESNAFNNQQSLRYVNGRFVATLSGGTNFSLTGTQFAVFVTGFRREPTTSDDGRIVSFTPSTGYDDNTSGSFYLGTGSNVGAASTRFTLHALRNAASTDAATPQANGPIQYQGYLLSTIFDGTNYTSWANGVAGTSTASTAAFNSPYLCLGANLQGNTSATTTSPTYYHPLADGNIGEVIFINGTLTTAERQQLEGYLAWHWGTVGSLPSGHPYKSAAPTVASSSSGSTRAWLPTDDNDLVAWWDASDLSASAVSTWTSKGPNKIAATQSTASQQPAYNATARNSKPGVVFTPANSQYLTIASPASLPLTNATVLVAAYMGTVTDGEWKRVFSYGASNTGSSSMEIGRPGTNNTLAELTLGNSTVTWNAVDRTPIVTKSGTAGALFIDGTASVTGTFAATFGNTTGFIGRGLDYSDYCPVTIQQIVMINRAMSTADRQKLEGWESWYTGKAGANLPSGHPYKSAAPTVSVASTTGSTTLGSTTTTSPWTPANFSTSQLNGWYDPSNSGNTIVSSAYSVVKDLSGGTTYNFIQNTANNRPPYLASGINSLPVMNFGTANSNKWMLSNVPAVNDVRTYVAIVNAVGTSTQTIFSSVSAAGLQFRIEQSTNYLGLLSDGTAQLGTSTTACPLNTPVLVVGSFNNTNGNYLFKINGSAAGSGNTTTRLGSSSSTVIGFNYAAGGEWFSGYIAESLAMGSAATADIEYAEGYLAWKWGTQGNLPAGHTYKNAAPTVTTTSAGPAPTTAVAWTPAMLNVLPLKWFDASDATTITQSNNVVSVWANKGQEPGNLTIYGTYTGPKYSTSGFNTLPAVTFDGTNYLDAPISINGPILCAFIVCCLTTANAGARAIVVHNHDVDDYSNVASTALAYMDSGSTTFVPAVYRNSAGVNFGTALWNQPALTLHGFDGTNAYIYGNGSTTPVTLGSTGSFTGSFIQLGARSNAGATTTSTSDAWIGPIAEVIVLGHTPTTAERQIYEGYLSWKWGLQSLLPSGHPYKSAPPAVAAANQLYQYWSPNDLPQTTLQGWYTAKDATTLTVAANAVSQWRDKSGKGRHLNQSTGANQPTYNTTAQNGYPAVVSNGSQFMRTTTGMAYPAGPLSVFILGVNQSSSLASGRLFSAAPSGVADTGTGGTALVQGSSGAGTFLWSVSGTATATASYAIGAVHIFEAYATSTTAGSVTVDGGFYTSSGSTTLNSTAVMDVMSIFAPATTGTTGWTGSITEMIVVSGVLSTADRQKIEGYLANLSGQTDLLPTSHPYKNSAPILPYVRRRMTMIES